MGRLTILHITSSENASGGARQSVVLARGQEAEGHRVVFAAPPCSMALDFAAHAGLECYEVPTGGIWVQWRSSRKLRVIAAETGADVVHTHHTAGHNVGLLATFGGGFPPLVANRGVLFRPKFPAKFRSRRNAALITNSWAVKGVLSDCGVQPDRIHVVYNARDMPDLAALELRKSLLREELGLDGSGPMVGGVGNSRPEKGYQFLVEAAPAILANHPDARFLLVGSGMDRFLPRLRELGISDRCILLGARPDAVDLMGLMDVFVIPSVGMESCPNVLLEAMGVACPVVGANTGGIAEVMADGATGFVVLPGDAAALAEAVCRLLSNPVEARLMGEAGRRRLGERFSLRTKVAETVGVYRRVLSRAGVSSS